MKRFWLVLLCIGLLAGIVGCSKRTEEKRALIYDFSDAVPEMSTNMEYDEWSKGAREEPNRQKEAAGTVGKIEYSGTYSLSYLLSETNENRHSYWGDGEPGPERDFFELDDEGFLVEYFWGYASDSEETKSQEECQIIARDFLLSLSGPSLEGYEEQVSYNEALDEYKFNYVKLIGGIESTDRVFVRVATSGHIVFYRATMWGKIDEAGVPAFDVEEVKKIVTARLDEMTVEARKKYDEVEYEEYYFDISKTADSKYCVLCSVDVRCREYRNDGIASSGERLKFMIPLE